LCPAPPPFWPRTFRLDTAPIVIKHISLQLCSIFIFCCGIRIDLHDPTKGIF
jgi:hypothetical protein